MNKEKRQYEIPRARFLEINEIFYTPQCPQVTMVHTFAEIFYQVSGKGQTVIEGAPVTLDAGELLLLNPGIQHYTLAAQTPRAKMLQLRADDLLFDFSGDGFAQYGGTGVDGNLLRCMYEMLRETTEREMGYEVVCDRLLSIAIVQLLRFTQCSLTVQGGGGLPVQCGMVQQYIGNHFRENLTLDLIAQRCAINKYYLVHLFKKATGTTPISYLNQRRLQEAEKLLKTTALPVAQIAQDVGFSSQNSFSQSFRRLNGVSPTQYRRGQNRGPEAAQ